MQKGIIMILDKRLKQFVKVLIILILPIIVSCNGKMITEPQPSPGDVKILFIGSSYFNYNNLPGLFKSLANANNKKVFIDYSIVNGTYLDYHASNPSTLNRINKQDWDYVVLQGVCTNVAFPETHHQIFPPYQSHPVVPAIESLMTSIQNNYQHTITLFAMPWAFEDGTTWLQGYNDTYEDMQLMIYNNTLEFSNDLGFSIAPVGWAWYEVLEDKNYPLHYLHLSDWNHPSLKGSYLMACVIYSCIFKESTTAIEYYANIPEQEATYFQEVSSSTVLDSLDLWRIE